MSPIYTTNYQVRVLERSREERLKDLMKHFDRKEQETLDSNLRQDEKR